MMLPLLLSSIPAACLRCKGCMSRRAEGAKQQEEATGCLDGGWRPLLDVDVHHYTPFFCVCVLLPIASGVGNI